MFFLLILSVTCESTLIPKTMFKMISIVHDRNIGFNSNSWALVSRIRSNFPPRWIPISFMKGTIFFNLRPVKVGVSAFLTFFHSSPRKSEMFLRKYFGSNPSTSVRFGNKSNFLIITSAMISGSVTTRDGLLP